MFVDPDPTGADAGQVLPDLAGVDDRADPHLITALARTAANIELRICTQVAPYDVAAEPWFPAAAGFTVTVIVRTVDAATGESRYLRRAEPDEWVRTIFATVEATGGYFLGAVDPDTGAHRRGQIAYRLYLDTDRRAIPPPRQLVAFPSTSCPPSTLVVISPSRNPPDRQSTARRIPLPDRTCVGPRCRRLCPPSRCARPVATNSPVPCTPDNASMLADRRKWHVPRGWHPRSIACAGRVLPAVCQR